MEPLSLGQLDYLGHFHAILAVGDIVDKLGKDSCALLHLGHAHLEACHGVAFFTDDFIEFKLIVYRIRLQFADIARPARCTSRRTGYGIRNGILAGKDADAFHTVLGDDVAGEYLVVFLDVFGENLEQSTYIVGKVGGEVLHHTAYARIVECHACATGLLEYIKDLFADAQCVEKHRGGSEVHAVCADEQAVRRDTRQLVHHHADHLGTARYLDVKGLLVEQAQAVVIDLTREIVKTVEEVKCLGILERLAEFLHAAVDIAHIYVDLLDGLAVDGGTEAQHTVRGRVLGADVHHEVVLMEYLALGLHDLAAFLFIYRGKVGLALVFDRHGVDSRILVIILAQRIAHPVDVEEKAAHIGIIDEDDAVEVIYFTLVDLGDTPQIGYRVNVGLVAVGHCDLHRAHGIVLGRHQIVDTAEFFHPVHSDDGNEIVHRCVGIVAEGLCQSMPLLIGNGNLEYTRIIVLESRGGEEFGNLFLYISHCCSIGLRL